MDEEAQWSQKVDGQVEGKVETTAQQAEVELWVWRFEVENTSQNPLAELANSQPRRVH